MKNMRKGLALIFIISISLLIPVIYVKSWYDPNWTYKKSHVIMGSSVSAVTNYQVGIKVYFGAGVDGTETIDDVSFGKVYTDSKCKADFGDIRFVNATDDTLFDYWMESKINSNNAIFWIELDDIPIDPNNVTIDVYYGNAAATTTSSGYATFPLFDHFLGAALNNTLWSSSTKNGGTITVGGSIIEFYIAQQVNSEAQIWDKVQFSTNYAIRSLASFPSQSARHYFFLGFGNRDHVDYPFTLSSESAQINEFGTSGNFVRTREGGATTNVAFTITYNNYRIFEVRRNAGTSVTGIESGGDMKTSAANIPDGNLYASVGGESNPGGTMGAARTMYVDWFLVRKYVDPEPSHQEWGAEETANLSPTITSASISNRDDGDNCYEMESFYDFVIVVNDGDGADDIAKVYLQIKQGGAVIAEIRATTLDGVPSYAIQTGATIIDLDTGSCSWAENGNEGTLHLLIRFEWDFIDQADLEISIYVEDTSAASAGFTVMQNNYFDVIGRLVISNLIVDDGRINLGGTATFSGKANYATTVGGNVASAKFPPDAQFTDIAIHDSAHTEKGNDVTIVNGVFSGISFAIPSSVQSNTYHVYLDLIPDYLDADAPDMDTVAVIGDRIIILTLTANVTLLEVGEYAQLRLTAELEFDHHALGAGDFVEVNSSVFTWDAGDSRFEVDVTSGIAQVVTYNLYTDGLEATFTITSENMDGNSVTLNFTIYPPLNPNLLFGAGFNASSPYVELHWNHTLQKVSVFEIRNSSDSVSWAYLGQSITNNYTDNQVLNGTYRYYKVRACNLTGGNWYNSSFSNFTFEKVYFNASIAGGGIVYRYPSPTFIMIIFLCSIGLLIIWMVKNK